MRIRAPFMAPDTGAAAGAIAPTADMVATTTTTTGPPYTGSISIGGTSGTKDYGNGSKDGKGAEPKSFDEILKENTSFQAELDRRINKAVETATANERDRQKIIQDGLQDEVLRVSKMTQDEKDAYFKQKAEKEANRREADLIKRELTLDARSALADKKLPDSFIDLLVYTDKDSCMKSIDIIDQAFQKAVQEAVNEKLKGSSPPADAKSEGAPASSQTAQDKALAQARALAGVKTK